ncbi:MAG: ATP-binding protein [Candidatus Thermoplasmatota archaeon]|nr:ATP-binding protein [Euryarchaeota archaeon]MBU4071937.1 ATP-binding protein [Candidatus Thermoplasmatota archaeon]MBU4144434.1 ATP-binding protein [Candidatus Thermoplasmatota archaeon]MBU4592468.1 ATP-binding protein [Candidatus Thermoplasmatota archaeon]
MGIVYGDVGTAELKCSVMAPLEKGEYVQVPHESCGPVLGQVDRMERKTNLSVDKAIKMSQGELMDIQEKVLAEITIIGYRDEQGLLQTPRAPFKAGSPVTRADDELITKVIGIKCGEKTGAFIGMLSGHDIPILLDINDMVSKHVSILAKTGGGKSYVTGVLVEELLKHDATVMVIDPHGEYGSLRDPGTPSEYAEKFGIHPRGYADQIAEFSPDTKTNKDAKPLRFTLGNLEARDIISLTNVKNVRQALPALKKVLEMIKATKPTFSMKDIIRTLEAQEDAQNVNLIQELLYLDDINIFAERGTKLDELVQKGKMTILNLKGTAPDIAGLIVNRVLTSLFEMRKINAIPPMLVVVDEAVNYCPQQGSTAASKIIRTIAAEGRKFGLGMVVITQRAAKIDKNVLSQCGTQIILKITNPLDLKAVISSVEGLTAGTTEEIQQLPLGIAIVCGAGLQVPLFIRVRPRETRHGGENVKIIED